MPVRQTLIKDIVEDRPLISSALGVSAMVFNLGRMIGPSIAGVMLVYVSEAWCFVLNALSYTAIIGALLAMRLPRASAPAATGAQPDGLRANLSVLMSFPGRPLSAADGGRHRPVRDALRAAHALDRGAFLRRPVLHRSAFS